MGAIIMILVSVSAGPTNSTDCGGRDAGDDDAWSKPLDGLYGD